MSDDNIFNIFGEHGSLEGVCIQCVLTDITTNFTLEELSDAVDAVNPLDKGTVSTVMEDASKKVAIALIDNSKLQNVPVDTQNAYQLACGLVQWGIMQELRNRLIPEKSDHTRTVVPTGDEYQELIFLYMDEKFNNLDAGLYRRFLDMLLLYSRDSNRATEEEHYDLFSMMHTLQSLVLRHLKREVGVLDEAVKLQVHQQVPKHILAWLELRSAVTTAPDGYHLDGDKLVISFTVHEKREIYSELTKQYFDPAPAMLTVMSTSMVSATTEYAEMLDEMTYFIFAQLFEIRQVPFSEQPDSVMLPIAFISQWAALREDAECGEITKQTMAERKHTAAVLSKEFDGELNTNEVQELFLDFNKITKDFNHTYHPHAMALINCAEGAIDECIARVLQQGDVLEDSLLCAKDHVAIWLVDMVHKYLGDKKY